ncbi:MAG: hypothetical protein FJX57_21665, partial [Alphaproteobacteria bacterium]|nr:hypothetical protein [Alphaproteobacteria bacterium]
ELTLDRGDGRDHVIKKNSSNLSRLDAALRHTDRNYFIAGYGAFRRPPERRSDWSRGRSGQLITMFSSARDLVSLEQWAIDLDYTSNSKGRNVIAEALRKLLPGMAFKQIDKSRRAVVMDTVDGDVPLEQLSEGYQAMAAWAGDLLFRLTETFKDRKDPLAARGVLLIDEMDLHLHPVWKRRLVEFLDSAFPNLQIVATTHSPLSIQQCREGELFVVCRESDRGPTLIPFKGDPSRLRLSELFLSPLIGLETLDSPRIAALREEARRIEVKRRPKTSAELQQLQTLESQLEGAAPLATAESPAFAPLIEARAAAAELAAVDRIRLAEALFGTKRPAIPAPKGREGGSSGAKKAGTKRRRAAQSCRVAARSGRG